MGLGRLRATRTEVEERGQLWALPGGYGYSTSGGGYGSEGWQTAARNAASWACIDVLQDGVARTPFTAIRNSGPSMIPVTPEPQLLARPSGVVLRDVWRSQLAFSLLTDGNAFGSIISCDRAGWPTQVELLDPSVVTVRKVVDGAKQVRVDYEPRTCWPFGDIWHLPGRMVPPGTPFALSPVEYANKVINTSLAAEEFSFQFFASGGHPVAVYYADKELTPQQAQDVKSAERRARENNRDPLVLGAGLKRDTQTIDPSETQFIDLMRFEVEQACRFWHVPPSMVFAAISGQNVTYANVSDADLVYLKHSLDGYLNRIEEGLTDMLPRPQHVKANRDAILRSDIKTRFGVYQIAIRNGIWNRNEIRTFEDQPLITDGTGDDYVWPPVGQGAGQDSKPPAGGGTIDEGSSTATPTPAA